MLSCQVLNETLKRLEVAEATKHEREKAALDRKLAAEAKKKAKKALERQWKLEHAEYIIQEIDWRKECAKLHTKWEIKRNEARIAHKRPPKKPTMPAKPKQPIKPRREEEGTRESRESPELPATAGIQFYDDNHEGEDNDDNNNGDMDMLRDSELNQFAEML